MVQIFDRNKDSWLDQVSLKTISSKKALVISIFKFALFFKNFSNSQTHKLYQSFIIATIVYRTLLRFKPRRQRKIQILWYSLSIRFAILSRFFWVFSVRQCIKYWWCIKSGWCHFCRIFLIFQTFKIQTICSYKKWC